MMLDKWGAARSCGLAESSQGQIESYGQVWALLAWLEAAELLGSCRLDFYPQSGYAFSSLRGRLGERSSVLCLQAGPEEARQLTLLLSLGTTRANGGRRGKGFGG